MKKKTELEAIGVCSDIYYNHFHMLIVSYHHVIFQKNSQKEFQEQYIQVFGPNLE